MYWWPLMKDSITFADRLKMAWFVMTTNRFTNGEKVKEFEQKWSDWLGTKYSLYVSSGSTANMLLVSAMKEKYGLKRGDKVVVSSCTWVTNVSPIIQLGLEPVFCDINLENYSFNIEHLKSIAAKHKDIKMVFVTHLLGLPADVQAYKEILPNAHFIEDVCESHGTVVDGKKAGTLSEGSTFSFYFGHHITTIEGGMVCTDDAELYELMRAKRSHGMARETSPDVFKKYAERYQNVNPKFLFITDGFNFRNHEICAVLGIEQLKRLDRIIAIRRRNNDFFHEVLADFKDYFYVPTEKGNSSFCFPFLAKDKKLATILLQKFDSSGIETRPIISGNLLRQPFLKDYQLEKENPNVEIVHENGFYVGNNHFVDKDHFDRLEKIIHGAIKEYEENQ